MITDKIKIDTTIFTGDKSSQIELEYHHPSSGDGEWHGSHSYERIVSNTRGWSTYASFSNTAQTIA